MAVSLVASAKDRPNTSLPPGLHGGRKQALRLIMCLSPRELVEERSVDDSEDSVFLCPRWVGTREAPEDDVVEVHKRSILSQPFRPNNNPPTAAERAVSRSGDDERPIRSAAPGRPGTDRDDVAPGCRGGGDGIALPDADEVEEASDFVGSGELR